MVIIVNENGRVMAKIDGEYADILAVDGIRTFKVDKFPSVEKGKSIYYDARTKLLYAVEEAEMVYAQRRQREVSAAVNRKRAALRWLADNDWKVNKYTLGEWNAADPRWVEYLNERKKVRAEIDSADAIINS